MHKGRCGHTAYCVLLTRSALPERGDSAKGVTEVSAVLIAADRKFIEQSPCVRGLTRETVVFKPREGAIEVRLLPGR